MLIQHTSQQLRRAAATTTPSRLLSLSSSSSASLLLLSSSSTISSSVFKCGESRVASSLLSSSTLSRPVGSSLAFHSSSSSSFAAPQSIRRYSSKFSLSDSSVRSPASINRQLNKILQQFVRTFSSSHSSFASSSSSSYSSSSSSSSSSPYPFSSSSLQSRVEEVLSSWSSSFSSSVRSLFSLVFNKAPRGFGHFDLDDKSPKKDKQSESNNEKKDSDHNKDKEKEKGSDTEKDGKKDEFSFGLRSDNKGGSPFGGSGGSGGSGGNNYAMFGIVALVLLTVGFVQSYSSDSSSAREITFQDFRIKYLEQGRVKAIEVNTLTKVVKVMLKPSGSVQLMSKQPQDTDQSNQFALNQNNSPNSFTEAFNNQQRDDYVQFSIGSIESFDRQLSDAQKEMGIDPHDFVPVKYLSSESSMRKINEVLSLALTLGFILLLVAGFRNMSGMMGGGGAGRRGGGGIFGVSKSPATVIQPGEMTKVKFSDVAGLDEAKIEVMEFVEFLKNKEKFEKLGARVPKGALLVGPPGTGKTLLAKAVAGEASVPFFSISGSDFVEMFVGVGPARVRDLFQQARQAAPCIVFIDEIDAVGRERGRGRFSGGNDERESTLNQLLVEMDGFMPSDGVVVLAGTNRQDILDKALLRPGRFDRQINIDKPDLRGRVDIFKVHLKKITVTMDIAELATRLAALTPGMTGADIANLCNEAAIIAARQGRAAVQLEDFERASDRIIGGVEKKSLLVNKKEKELVAYHEAGHAVLGWFLEYANPVLKVTIVPRASGALGFAQSLPNELHLYHQDQLNDMMVMTLGGRAAEEIFFKRVSTGAADDLTKVNDLAKAQVTKFGMSKRLGQIAFKESDEQGLGGPSYSDATAQIIDEEIRLIANAAYERAIALVKEYHAKIEALAQRLLSSETVNHDVLVEILGERPFQTDSYLEYVKQQRQAHEDIKKQKEKDAAKAKEVKTETKKSDSTNRPNPQPAAA